MPNLFSQPILLCLGDSISSSYNWYLVLWIFNSTNKSYKNLNVGSPDNQVILSIYFSFSCFLKIKKTCLSFWNYWSSCLVSIPRYIWWFGAQFRLDGPSGRPLIPVYHERFIPADMAAPAAGSALLGCLGVVKRRLPQAVRLLCSFRRAVHLQVLDHNTRPHPAGCRKT